MFIPDPGSWFLPIPDTGSRISDPGSKNSNKRERWKKICYHTFFCSHKFNKIEYYVIFEMLKKKIWANFQRTVEVFTQKIFNMLSNIWVWDPGKNLFRIPDPGVKKAPDPGSGSATLVRHNITNSHLIYIVAHRPATEDASPHWKLFSLVRIVRSSLS